MHLVFFFNDTATTEIYTLSLHDALPISAMRSICCCAFAEMVVGARRFRFWGSSARTARNPACISAVTERARARALGSLGRSEEHTSELQSRHISYAVFCLKKKKPTGTLL